EHGVSVRNCWKAVVYKVPAANLRDFMLQTHRGYAAVGARRRRRAEVAAAALEAAKDPLGALLYARARLWSAREQRRRPSTWREEWDVTPSTKRGLYGARDGSAWRLPTSVSSGIPSFTDGAGGVHTLQSVLQAA